MVFTKIGLIGGLLGTHGHTLYDFLILYYNLQIKKNPLNIKTILK